MLEALNLKSISILVFYQLPNSALYKFNIYVFPSNEPFIMLESADRLYKHEK